MSLNRIVPTIAHRLLVSIKGSQHNVRGTPIDFKNFYNGMRIFIGDRDSQLVIDRLKDRYEYCPKFFFDFIVENGKLRSIFWADEISKLNYKAFGHVLAFDATYQTNRYKMIFVPFTTKNVSGDVIENTNIRSRIHRLVWKLFIIPDTFQSRWHYLIEKFGLQDSEWLKDMFDIRDHWVPAYFRDIPIKKVDKIPLKYVSDRWKQDVLPRSVFSLSDSYIVDSNPQSVLRFEILEMANDNESVFVEIIGNVNEGDDFIENPDAVRTKGCGKVRRVMGEMEKNVEKESKVARLCRTCGEYVYHDSRNCPSNPKNKKKKSLAEPETSDNV
ncbi:protein FAR1-RELATED SEQUENCE 5-like [Bidens hawaiensis]|uniref:protein FAR1-RELATED SEQUENCE 5-like n=1 Tax=Bidens hawaiensis TaxID=980011 RepID=UPI00404AB5A9